MKIIKVLILDPALHDNIETFQPLSIEFILEPSVGSSYHTASLPSTANTLQSLRTLCDLSYSELDVDNFYIVHNDLAPITGFVNAAVMSEFLVRPVNRDNDITYAEYFNAAKAANLASRG